MRNQDDGFAAAGAGIENSLENFPRLPVVKPFFRLVQNQAGGVFQQRTRNGEPTDLPA